MSILFNNTYKAFSKRGNFSGEFYARSMGVDEARTYHESFDYGYEVNDINETGLFRLIILGNQYYTAIRIYCDEDIMNLGAFTIYGVNGSERYVGDGRGLEFFDYGEGYSFYLIYAGNPSQGVPSLVNDVDLIANTNNTINISYEYGLDYTLLGTSITIDRIENNTVYYSFKYEGTIPIRTVDIRLQYKYVNTTYNPWGGSTSTTEWRDLEDIAILSSNNTTSYTYQSNYNFNFDPSVTYTILAIVSYSNGNQDDMRSSEFQAG